MKINIPKTLVDKTVAHNQSPMLIKALAEQLTVGRRSIKFLSVNGLTLEKETLKFLHSETRDSTAEYANTIEFLYKAVTKPASTIVKSIDDVLPALMAYCKSAGLKNYLFERGPFKMVLPYVVTVITDSNTETSRSGYRSRYTANSINVLLRYTEKCVLKDRSLTFRPDTLCSIFEANGVAYTKETKTENRGGNDEYTFLVDAKSPVGVSVDKLLSHYDLFLETAELHALLDSQLTKYLTCIKNYGRQFLVRGSGTAITDSWYSSGQTSMLVEARPGRAIMDTVLPSMMGEDEDKGTSNRKRRYRDDDEDDDDNAESTINASPKEMQDKFDALSLEDLEFTAKSEYPIKDSEVIVPNHPKVKIFHLIKAQSFWVHVNNLTPYKYKDGMEEQLILPESVKEMTRMLVTNSADDSEDIVEGKTQSTIIAAVGDPGLGKTLMCEVLSESCCKPLYKVQAAQLGETPAELEKNLQRILLRAQRWNAILLIDEANAYIHSRGHDIRQNAIVGVFLRLLDYYRGILIFTTNMTQGAESGDLGFDIDQAIISRCTAVIKFNLPDKDQAKRLWLVQCKLRGLEMDPALLARLVETYTLSGRTIRNLLKMACSAAANKEESLAFKHFVLAAEFVPMSQQELATT